MSENEIEARAETLFAAHQQQIYQRTDRMFARLMLFQWIVGIVCALWLTPRTWAGSLSQTHLHVWMALFLGGAFTFYPIFLTRIRPGTAFTRHIIAINQLLMTGLLIHLTGGRIETHFHVFGSLAFLAFYRDRRVLVTGTLVTAADHLLRGFFWPQSVYGIEAQETWRWLEHAGWVLFEDGFLFISCRWGLQELRGLCERDARLEASNSELEHKIERRTTSLREANARLEALATSDPLIGLPNHRALVTALDQELARSRRYHRACAVIFLDLDHFKALNDSCGHAAGDAALQELGQVAKQCLRGMDTLGRWGGEEFIALLPETDTQNALAIAERIRAAIAAHPFSAGGGVYLTCSAGIAVFPDHATDRSELIAAADQAMYAAKRLGRNQVRSMADPLVKTLEAGGDTSREEATMQGTVEALASLVEARDPYTSEHVEGVTDLAISIAQTLGLEAAEVRLIGLVGRLHDVGKMAVPDAILQKPGKLSEEEWALMRMHPIIGADVVSHVPMLRVAAPGIRSHHERWDGKGYPDGLAGEAIPLAARIVMVADTYNAITTDRPYRKASSHDVALRELRRCAGTQFDAAIVEALEKYLAVVAEEARLPQAA